MKRVLVCPFCDELAEKKKGFQPIYTPHKIYTPMMCPMGHEFYSVEEVPEDQSAIVTELKGVRKDAREWKHQLKLYKP